MKHIVYVTSSRADYGISRNYLRKLNNDSDLNLGILVTGALLEDEYGKQVDLIRQDGFNIEKEIKLDISTKSTTDVVHAMATCLDKFNDYFSEAHIDLLIVLGDRYEMLSVVTAAAMHKIPILHLHGGEATYANYDEFIRHSITKMSRYHFTSTEAYRNRVIQLGEDPDRVFNLGSLGAENCTHIDEEKVIDEVKQLSPKGYFVVLFHPETLTNIDVLEQANAIIEAVSNFNDYKFIFMGSNADTKANVIRERFKQVVDSNDNMIYFENLNTDSFQYLLKNSIALIGNSSCGIIEAPTLGIRTINIGDRQKGRIQGNSILNVNCQTDEITNAINTVLDNKDIQIDNPYYQENASDNYYNTTKKILETLEEDTKEPKHFYDIEIK